MPSLLLHPREGEEVQTEEDKSSSSGLSWLLPLAIGGGVLLFLAMGLLLSWKIRARKKPPLPARVYSMRDDDDLATRPRSRRLLTKRQGPASEYTTESCFSSRISLSLPPVLPPLPSYDGIFGYQHHSRQQQSRGGRERSWLDEDALHGPKVRKSIRDSWIFNSPSWFGRTPTLPEFDMSSSSLTAAATTAPSQRIVVLADKRESANKGGGGVGAGDRLSVAAAAVVAAHNKQQQQQQPPSFHVQRPPVKSNQTAHMLAMQHGALRNWSRTGAQQQLQQQAQHRREMTESNLQDILRSTEERLRTGNSQQAMTASSTESSLGRGSNNSAHSLHLLGRSHSHKNNLSAAPPPPQQQKKSAMPLLPDQQQQQQQQRPLHRRSSSVFSVASVSNYSLLGEATSTAPMTPTTHNELELLGFGARQTFGRLTADEDDDDEYNKSNSNEYHHRVQDGGDKKKKEEEEAPIDLDAPPMPPKRPASAQSAASSSLSTLYSVGDAEDGALRSPAAERRSQSQSQAQTQAQTQTRDEPQARAENHTPTASTAEAAAAAAAAPRSRLTGPRPLRRQNLSITRLGLAAEDYMMPMPLRPISLNPQVLSGQDKDADQKPEPLKLTVLPPPQQQQPRALGPEGTHTIKNDNNESAGYRSVSETSKVTESDSDGNSDTAKASLAEKQPNMSGWRPVHDEQESLPQNSLEKKAVRSDNKERDRPLSMLNDEDKELLSLLTADPDTTAGSFPIPPPHTAATTISTTTTATTTKPTPRARLGPINDAHRASICSSVGSIYSEDEVGGNGNGNGLSVGSNAASAWSLASYYGQDPVPEPVPEPVPPIPTRSRRMSTRRTGRTSQAVGSTIAQLRRMNSTVSTYSLASTVFEADQQTTAVADSHGSFGGYGYGQPWGHGHSHSQGQGQGQAQHGGHAYTHSYSHSYSSSRSRNSGISTRHYFNLGGSGTAAGPGPGPGSDAGSAAGASANTSARPKPKQSREQREFAAQRRRSRRMSVARLQPTLSEQSDHGKENQAPMSLRMPYIEASTSSSSSAATAAATAAGAVGGGNTNNAFSRDSTLVGRVALGRAQEFKVDADAWRRGPSLRDVEDDLSMYDNGDGFLQASPKKADKNRCLRM